MPFMDADIMLAVRKPVFSKSFRVALLSFQSAKKLLPGITFWPQPPCITGSVSFHAAHTGQATNILPINAMIL